jgi:dCTP deaminase
MRQALFPELTFSSEPTRHSTGIFPSQSIRELIKMGRVSSQEPIEDGQIQPASLDLRLADVAYRVQASFLPGRNATVQEKIAQLRIAELDLTKPTILEKGCVYVVPVLEEVEMGAELSGKANPKSSTGRLDVFTRLITDYGIEFEHVPRSYKGRLYVEIVPRTFTVIVRRGMRLNQLRFVRGAPTTPDKLISTLDEQDALVYLDEDSPVKAEIRQGLRISVNLGGEGDVVAYRAKKSAPAIDMSQIGVLDPRDYWEVVLAPLRGRGIVLDPGDFYILSSKERVRVPPEVAAELVPFDPSMGEFRIHYAGFFDPGFGYGVNEIKGTRAVLEVRAHEVPFLIEDGQIVGRLIYMRLLARPDRIYGQGIGSSYQQQGLALSKHFKRF